MIKLNLILDKKSDSNLLAGINISAINFKMLVLAIAIYYIPEYGFRYYFDSKIKNSER